LEEGEGGLGVDANNRKKIYFGLKYNCITTKLTANAQVQYTGDMFTMTASVSSQ